MPSRLEAVEGIHDLVALHLSKTTDAPGLERIVALRFEDHLLRRFGQAEIVRLAAGSRLVQPAQKIADEVWILVDGGGDFEWADGREASPTHGATAGLECDEPIAVLVPFGVGLSLTARAATILLRLRTHSGDDRQPDSPPPA